MSVNNIKKISKIISLLDVTILKLFEKDAVDGEKLNNLTDTRFYFVEKLKNLQRIERTKELLDKKYLDNFK